MKQKIRKEFLEKRKSLSQTQVVEYSNNISKNLRELKEFKNSNTVLYYVSFNNEVDTINLIKESLNQNKKVIIPKIVNNDLELFEIKSLDNLKKNQFHILEPANGKLIADYSIIDLVIVPGVVFDLNGHRIGFGKGYYDKFLKKIKCLKVGLAYDFQIKEKIPSEDHDIPMDIIISQTRTIRPHIINGRLIAQKVYSELKNEISLLKIKPKLAVILIGENPASKIYVSIKEKKCKEVGIISKIYKFEKDISQSIVIDLIQELNANKNISGILVQLPLPKHLDEDIIINTIDNLKDVDCLTNHNIGKLFSKNPYLQPCTPKGIIKLLDSNNVEIEGKNAVVIGKSNIVGKPIALMLLNKNATVTICHSKTKNLPEITKKADILVVAIGKPLFIAKEMIKENAIVIDVGTTLVDGKLKGDVDFNNVKNKCSLITPVPGGVGPMTVAMLMKNTLLCYKKKLVNKNDK